jgi:hypothetical protein
LDVQLILIEAAVEMLESALAAERAGADRIELCVNLNDGGTTPSMGLTAAAVEGPDSRCLYWFAPGKAPTDVSSWRCNRFETAVCPTRSATMPRNSFGALPHGFDATFS